jgi:SAM-dependent methyltransferase
VPIARNRLEPLGVKVVKVKSNLRLPFEDKAFDLVLNRHTEFDAKEVWRILKPGGTLLTQQVGSRNKTEIIRERMI